MLLLQHPLQQPGPPAKQAVMASMRAAVLLVLLAVASGLMVEGTRTISRRSLITNLPSNPKKCNSTILEDTDFLYGDLTTSLDKKYQGVAVADASACCVRCQYTDGCSRWTFVGADKRCWLKGNSGYTQKAAKGLTSGVLAVVGKSAPGSSGVTTTTTGSTTKTENGVVVKGSQTSVGSGNQPVVARSDVSKTGTGDVTVISTASSTNLG